MTTTQLIQKLKEQLDYFYNSEATFQDYINIFVDGDDYNIYNYDELQDAQMVVFESDDNATVEAGYKLINDLEKKMYGKAYTEMRKNKTISKLYDEYVAYQQDIDQYNRLLENAREIQNIQEVDKSKDIGQIISLMEKTEKNISILVNKTELTKHFSDMSVDALFAYFYSLKMIK